MLPSDSRPSLSRIMITPHPQPGPASPPHRTPDTPRHTLQAQPARLARTALPRSQRPSPFARCTHTTHTVTPLGLVRDRSLSQYQLLSLPPFKRRQRRHEHIHPSRFCRSSAPLPRSLRSPSLFRRSRTLIPQPRCRAGNAQDCRPHHAARSTRRERFSPRHQTPIRDHISISFLQAYSPAQQPGGFEPPWGQRWPRLLQPQATTTVLGCSVGFTMFLTSHSHPQTFNACS